MIQTSADRPQPLFAIPPLENGDRLSRAEFERRYAAMPHLHKAELVEGIVYIPAAVPFQRHGQPHSHLNGWLMTYQVFTPGTQIGDTPTVRLGEENEPQPDVVLLIQPSCGGQVILSDDDYIEGAPELVAEVAASSVSIDLGSKKNAYERNGVQEYIVWRVLDQQIDWFSLQDGQYVALAADPDGITRSRIFPGLWLERAALISGEMKRVLAVLQAGLTSATHQTFLQQLQPS